MYDMTLSQIKKKSPKIRRRFKGRISFLQIRPFADGVLPAVPPAAHSLFPFSPFLLIFLLPDRDLR